ncbi:unnamed protein product [Mortierella alpina]
MRAGGIPTIHAYTPLASSSAYHDDDYKLDRADRGACSQERAKAVVLLLGRPIADLLTLEQTSYPQPIHQQHPDEGVTVQSFILSEQVLGEYNSNILSSSSSSVRQGDPHTRRLHGCIHTSVPYGPRRSSDASTAARSWSPDRQQQQDQVVPQLSSDEGASASTTPRAGEAVISLCRVYVLKDATDMVGLAQEILQQQQQQRQQTQRLQQQQQEQHYHSMHLVPPIPSLPPSSTSPSSAHSDRPALSLHSVTRHELYSSHDDAHWSGEALMFQDEEDQRAANNDRALVLLLQVTRFGTVDHAFTLEQQQPGTDDHGPRPHIRVLHLTNTSVTAFVHPDDIRTLCRGLDRVCKSLHTLLRIRWRIQARTLSDLRCLNNHVQEKKTIPAVKEQKVHSRWIEFQGEYFEEWVDPTALPDKASSPRTNQGNNDSEHEKVQVDDEDEEAEEVERKDEDMEEEEDADKEIYAWVEVTGTLSDGQPLLAVRPLTAQERLEQEEKTCMASGSILSSPHSMRSGYKHGAMIGGLIKNNNINNSDDQDVDLWQESTQWRGKSKRMESEEGMRMPRQLDVSSALTALTRISSQESMTGSTRMPGSFPFHMTQTPQQRLLQQQLQHVQQQRHPQWQPPLSPPLQQQPALSSFSSEMRCLFYSGHSRSSSGLVSPMSSVLACPTSTSNAPWSLVMSAALEAWRQWIQVVHVGQAQFQDWCEYVLETTIDQLIESVSLGLALLGVENPLPDRCLEEQPSHTFSSSSSPSLSFNKAKRTRSQSQDRAETYKRQKKMSGLHRAGQLLQGYPSLEGVVRSFGNSWLGQKIRSRLEHKMERVADQVVDWWEGEKDQNEEEQEQGDAMVVEEKKVQEEAAAHHQAAVSSQLSDGPDSSPKSGSWSRSRSRSVSLTCSTMTEMEVADRSKDHEGSLETVVAAETQAAKSSLATTVN